MASSNGSDKYLLILESLPSLTSRLGIIELSTDQLININFYICFSELESYVFGVLSQYTRIIENTPTPSTSKLLSYSLKQIKLDVYYYILTWDKLRKVFEKFKLEMNSVSKSPSAMPSGFSTEFKQIKTRMDHLFNEHSIDTRNEYEHPSLEPSRIGNLIGLGNSTSDNNGNLTVHVGKEEFAYVRKEHVDRLYSLWIELIDLFIKYFTDKPSTAKLLSVKSDIEEHIDELIDMYNQLRQNKETENAQNLFNRLLSTELYLSSEGCSLHKDVKGKIYTILRVGSI